MDVLQLDIPLNPVKVSLARHSPTLLSHEVTVSSVTPPSTCDHQGLKNAPLSWFSLLSSSHAVSALVQQTLCLPHLAPSAVSFL